MAVSGRDIAQLERAVSNQLAAYSQSSGAIFDKLPPIKVNALNQQFPIFKGMVGYNPNGNQGAGGDRVQTLMDPVEYRPAAVFYTDKTFEIPLSTKRAMSVLDDPEGNELVRLVSQGVSDSKFITMDYNIHNAVKSQKYEAGTNIFTIGNINADTAGGAFRAAINDAISYLKKVLKGMNANRNIIIAIPEEAWNKLTASQKLTNFFNGYAQENAHFNMQTINAIFSQNAGINIDVQVAGLRFLDARYESGDANLVWGEELEFYLFVSTNSLMADRASIKRLEGIEKLNVYMQGNTTNVAFYCDYGYYIDVPEAFAKVTFTVSG